MRISDWSSDVCSSDLRGVEGVDDLLEVVDVADGAADDRESLWSVEALTVRCSEDHAGLTPRGLRELIGHAVAHGLGLGALDLHLGADAHAVDCHGTDDRGADRDPARDEEPRPAARGLSEARTRAVQGKRVYGR